MNILRMRQLWTDTVKTVGFLLLQVGATVNYVVPVNTLETLTGLDFYPELSNSIENSVESPYELRKLRIL